MYLYADDTVLLSYTDNIDDCKDNMQRSIEIANWCRSNKLSINIKCMIFGSRVGLLDAQECI